MNTTSIEKNLFYAADNKYLKKLYLLITIAIAILTGWLIAQNGIGIAAGLIIFPFIVGYLLLIFIFPRIGLVSFLIYSFMMPTLGRHIEGLQVGLGLDFLLLLTWLGVIFHRGKKYRFRHLNNDLLLLAVIWLVITILQIGNPAKPSIIGWLQEMRSAILYWILVVPLAILIFNKKSDIYFFTDIIITFSFIGSLWALKQLNFGVDAAEQRWLDGGAYKTHILFGKLRIFSYYTEAAQFGASQSQLGMMCLILALGPHSKLRKIIYAVAAAFMFYGMLMSGTRSAIGGIIGAGIIFLLLSKKFKIFLLGSIIGLGFFIVLKFTQIGSGSDQIRRFRTSVDVNDASFQVRIMNQETLRNMLRTKPFGTGVGTIGEWGMQYNKHIPSSGVQPDSLFVKMWAMYGVVGFMIWLGMMLYILGKSVGLIWNIRDPLLRNQLCALCAGFAGILFISYANEVMNAMPSLTIVYVSWALIWMSTRWDTPINPNMS